MMQNNEDVLIEIIEYLLDALEEEHIGLKAIYTDEIKNNYGVDINAK